MASSTLRIGEPVIHDGSPFRDFDPGPFGTGLDLSGRCAEGYSAAADPFPASLLIDPSEWQARIAEMEATKSRLSDLILQSGLPCKNQEQTNFCWGNAPTHGIEVVRMLQNEPQVILSPASVCAQITGYRNTGGWGPSALAFISDRGVVPADRWPANAIDPRYATEANAETALRYRNTEWWSCDPQDVNQLVSCLLRRVPVAVGYSWWGHEVLAVDAAWLDGAVAVRIRNSWGMSWGSAGFGVLQGSRLVPDDAVAPRVARAAA